MIGSRTLRIEDEPYLRGQGRYIDDIVVPGQLQAAFVRSSTAMMNRLSYLERYAWFALEYDPAKLATGLYDAKVDRSPVLALTASALEVAARCSLGR